MTGKYVEMSVQCLGDECINCEFLAIRVMQQQMYSGAENVGCINGLRCEHLGRCLRLAEMLEKQRKQPKETEKRPAVCNGPGTDGCYECEKNCDYR